MIALCLFSHLATFQNSVFLTLSLPWLEIVTALENTCLQEALLAEAATLCLSRTFLTWPRMPDTVRTAAPSKRATSSGASKHVLDKGRVAEDLVGLTHELQLLHNRSCWLLFQHYTSRADPKSSLHAARKQAPPSDDNCSP